MRWQVSMVCVAAALAVASASEATPKSLFVQATSVPAGTEAYKTRTWFKKVCDSHRTPGAANIIHNLVLSEIADTAGTLDDARLSIIEDYFVCFDNVFVGTANLPHSDPYVSGMKNSTFRWDNIYLSEKVAKAYQTRFAQKFPSEDFHWYISYEANLNYLATDTALKNAYAAYLLELSNRLTAIRPGSVLWSPAFWTKYTSVGNSTSLRNAIADVINTAPKINWLHFQDFVGQAAKRNCSTGSVSYWFNENDGIGYYNLVNQAVGTKLQSLRINMEHFVSGGSGCPALSIYPGQAAELSKRETAYQAAGVPIGASWEIRWWYQALYGSEGSECDAPEVCNGSDDDCDLKVDEGDVCGGGTGGSGGNSGGAPTGGAAGADGGGSSGISAGGAARAVAGSAGQLGGRPAGREDSGCGCRIVQSAPSGPFAWVCALLFLGLRRKQRYEGA